MNEWIVIIQNGMQWGAVPWGVKKNKLDTESKHPVLCFVIKALCFTDPKDQYFTVPHLVRTDSARTPSWPRIPSGVRVES